MARSERIHSDLVFAGRRVREKSENICLLVRETAIVAARCGIAAITDHYLCCFPLGSTPDIDSPGTSSSSRRLCTSVAGTKYRIVVSSDL